jgi:Na+-transporting NADH:ubiquinone oxidoreductase subunit NqrD
MEKRRGLRLGSPLCLLYTRPVQTAVIVGLPMAYLTAVSSAIYLVSAFLLRVTSGYAFPLLPVAAWIVALTVVVVAATLSTRDRATQVVVMACATAIGLWLAMQRLTAVEIPDTFDWPPRLWPTLFDFPLTDYAWIALIGLASFRVAVVSVAQQRHGDAPAAIPWTAGVGLRAWLTNLFSIPCPTSSATRAQAWFDLKFSGLPVLTIGVALAIVILLSGVVSIPIDAALPSDFGTNVPCAPRSAEPGCFHARGMTVMLAVFSLLIMLFQGGNAFGIRSFEAAQAYGTAQLTALKLLVRSACFLAALIAVGVSVWTSASIMGDEVFIQMRSVPLSRELSAIKGAVAALTGMLVDEGKMRWDDPADQHLPYFKLAVKSDDPAARATLRELLSHRTGFPRMSMLTANGALSSEEILRQASQAEPLSTFRQRFHYSNEQYMAAGWAAAAAAGRTGDELTRSRILDPLGMTNTETSTRRAGALPDLAHGYRWQKENGSRSRCWTR